MKLIGRRAWILLVICLLFLAGMVFFIITYIQDAPGWASSNMNDHIFREGRLVSAGAIEDAEGEPLAYTEDGARKYSDNEKTREALMHLVGDPYGNVSTSLQVAYRDKLVGWNYLSGLYSFGDRTGNTIETTVSSDVAEAAYSALNGRRGTVGIMNYQTGEVLCMVSSPSLDPVNPPDIEANPEKYDGVYINRLLSATYTPGSIFKLVTASAALNEIPGIEDRTFQCSGQITIEGGTIICTHAHGNQTFTKTFVNSCNVAYAEMAVEIGAEKMTQYAEAAGLNTELTLGKIETATGVFTLQGADDLALAWAGAGQYKTLINPLSYLQYVASIPNYGNYVSPKIVGSITTTTGLPAGIDLDASGDRSMDAATAVALKNMLRACVTESYGEGGLEGYNMSAKTGTAEVGEEGLPHSWYCGFLDSSEAPLAFIVLVENGGTGRSAAYDVAIKTLKEAVNN